MFNLHAFALGRVRGWQIARPTSDVSAGSWTPTPLWSKLNDSPAADDSTYVQTASGLGAQAFRVAMSSLLTPPTNVGHKLRVRLAYITLAPTGDTVVSLYQSTVLRAQFTITGASIPDQASGFGDFLYTLTPTEAASITDFTTLRVDVNYDPGGVGIGGQGLCSYVDFQTPAP